jgi:hypothetical protein
MLNRLKFGQEVDKRSKKLEDLHTIGLKIISSLDLSDLITRVVEAGVYITNTEAGAIYLLDHETNKLFEKAYKGPGEKNAKLLSNG